MRFLLAAAVLLALPADAQTVEREVETEIVTDGERVVRYRVSADTTDGPRRVVIRMDSVASAVGGLFRPDGPLGSRMRRFEIAMDGDELRFETEGVDDATRERMAELDARARRLARAARDGDAQADRELDDVLGELFTLRGDMRRQRADALRDRADRLREQARTLDDEVESRARDRRAIIEARKRELLGRDAAADW